jgi:hypothetical protein
MYLHRPYTFKVYKGKKYSFLPSFVKTGQNLKLCTLCAFVSAQGSHLHLKNTQAYDLERKRCEIVVIGSFGI